MKIGFPGARPPRSLPQNRIGTNRAELEELGRVWVRYIREEALKDAQKSSSVPRDPAFYRSFGYRVEGGRHLVIFSAWPWVELLNEGTRAYKMTWLTRSSGVARVPFVQPDGTVLFRATPLTAAEAWVHPGIARHHFIQRAYEKAWAAMGSRMVDRVLGEVFR